MKKNKKEKQEYILDWEEYSKQNNVILTCLYTICYIVYNADSMDYYRV